MDLSRPGAAAALLVRSRFSPPGGGFHPPVLSDQDWHRLLQLPGAARAVTDVSPEQRRLVRALLGSAGDGQFSELSRDQRQIAVGLLSRLAHQLAGPLSTQARRAKRVVLSRWLRIGTSAAVLGVLLASVVVKGGWFHLRNLALHRPVTVSSVFESDIGRDPSLLVDGDTTNLGFHTAYAPNQYVIIDLGTVQSIRRVVVYNRVDCCQDRAIPLHIEVSTDGKSYQQVATRTNIFIEWDAEFPSVDARYVKLMRPKQDYFHLAEVEVY